MGFDAFISYNQDADGSLAGDLERGLERLARKWNQRRAMRVFRDASDLAANPNLWESISQSMATADWLVVLCSPAAAASPWVNKEIEHWISINGGSDRVLLAITGGTWGWSNAQGDFDPDTSDAIPGVLSGAFENEPLVVDLRWADQDADLSLRNSRWRDSVSAIAAPIRGIDKDELESEDLRQFKKSTRLRRAAVAALAALAIGLGIAAVAAVLNAQEAGRQRDEAGRQRDEAIEQAANSQAHLARITVSQDMRSALANAVEAYEVSSNNQTKSVLLELLQETSPLVWSRQVDDEVTTAVPAGSAVAYGLRSGDIGVINELGVSSPLVHGGGAVVDITADPSGTVVSIAWDSGEVAVVDVAQGLEVLRSAIGEPAWAAAPLDQGGPGAIVYGESGMWLVDKDGVSPMFVGGDQGGGDPLRVLDRSVTYSDFFGVSIDLDTGVRSEVAGPGNRGYIHDTANGWTMDVDDRSRFVNMSVFPVDQCLADTVGRRCFADEFEGWSFEREFVELQQVTFSGDASRVTVLSNSILETWADDYGAVRVSRIAGVDPVATGLEVDHEGASAVTYGGKTIQRWNTQQSNGVLVQPEVSTGGAADSLVAMFVEGPLVYWLHRDIGESVVAVLDLTTMNWSHFEYGNAVAALNRLEAMEEIVECDAVSPDGSLAVTIAGGRVVITNVVDGTGFAAFASDSTGLCAFSEDGQHLIKASRGGGLEIWGLDLMQFCDDIDLRVGPGTSELVCAEQSGQ